MDRYCKLSTSYDRTAEAPRRWPTTSFDTAKLTTYPSSRDDEEMDTADLADPQLGICDAIAHEDEWPACRVLFYSEEENCISTFSLPVDSVATWERLERSVRQTWGRARDMMVVSTRDGRLVTSSSWGTVLAQNTSIGIDFVAAVNVELTDDRSNANPYLLQCPSTMVIADLRRLVFARRRALMRRIPTCAAEVLMTIIDTGVVLEDGCRLDEHLPDGVSSLRVYLDSTFISNAVNQLAAISASRADESVLTSETSSATSEEPSWLFGCSNEHGKHAGFNGVYRQKDELSLEQLDPNCNDHQITKIQITLVPFSLSPTTYRHHDLQLVIEGYPFQPLVDDLKLAIWIDVEKSDAANGIMHTPFVDLITLYHSNRPMKGQNSLWDYFDASVRRVVIVYTLNDTRPICETIVSNFLLTAPISHHTVASPHNFSASWIIWIEIDSPAHTCHAPDSDRTITTRIARQPHAPAWQPRLFWEVLEDVRVDRSTTESELQSAMGVIVWNGIKKHEVQRHAPPSDDGSPEAPAGADRGRTGLHLPIASYLLGPFRRITVRSRNDHDPVSGRRHLPWRVTSIIAHPLTNGIEAPSMAREFTTIDSDYDKTPKHAHFHDFARRGDKEHQREGKLRHAVRPAVRDKKLARPSKAAGNGEAKRLMQFGLLGASSGR